MKGRSSKPQPFVLESDIDLEPHERTVFWLVCKNNRMGNESVERYARARIQRPDGALRYDPRKLEVADKEEFLIICKRVDNYSWSEEFLEKHPQVRTRLNGNGYDPGPIEDPDDLAALFDDLPSGVMPELLMAASNQVTLDMAAKKNLSSSHGITSGAQNPPAG